MGELADVLRPAFPDIDIVIAATPELDTVGAGIADSIGVADGTDVGWLTDGLCADAVGAFFDAMADLFGSGSFYDGSSRIRQDIDDDGEFDLLGQFVAPKDSLVIESDHERAVTLTWTTLIEAADEAGLSRLHGGIRLRADDLPGRTMGQQVGLQVFAHANAMFIGAAVGPGDELDRWA